MDQCRSLLYRLVMNRKKRSAPFKMAYSKVMQGGNSDDSTCMVVAADFAAIIYM